jgi:hypothetical protein
MGNTFDFSMFNADQVFTAQKLEGTLDRMVLKFSEHINQQQLNNEMKRKNNELLKAGVDSIMDESTIKRKIFDVDQKDRVVLGGILEIAKSTLKLSKQTYDSKESVKKQTIDIKKLEDELDKKRTAGGVRNMDFEKHLEKTIRDQTHLVELEKIKNNAMINAHPLGATMGKALSSGIGQGLISVFGSIASILSKVVGGIVSIVKGVFNMLTSVLRDTFDLWLKIQTLTGNIAADMGQTEIQTQQINNNIGQIGIAAAQWGVNIEDALSFITQFSQITGLNHILLVQQIGDLSAIAKATGLGVQTTGEMYANLELIGYSTSMFHKYVESTRKTSAELGINITKVLTTVNKLLPAYNALNFKDGLKGLTALVIKTQGLRFELDNMRNLAVQIFNPEGAIELSAKLRVLGGNFAKMADPFSLMLKAQTDAAGLIDDVVGAVSGLAVKGKDGIFSIPPAAQGLIREFAAATGESVDNLVKTSLQTAKQNDVMNQLRSRGVFNAEDLNAIANLAERDEITGKYMVKVDMLGTQKAIDELNQGLIDKARGVVRDEQQVASNRMNLMEQLKNMYNMFLFSLQPLFRPIEALFRDSGFMAALQRTMADLGQFIANKLVPLFSSGSGVYEWMFKLGAELKTIIEGVAGVLKGSSGVFDAIAKMAVYLVTKMWDAIEPRLKEIFTPVKEKIKSGAGTAGAWAGALAVAPAAISAAIPTMGASLLAIPLAAWLGHNLAEKSVGGIADDFIMRSNGGIQKFNKDDVVIGGTNLDGQNNKGNMTPSRDIMTQVPMYPKEKYAPLNAYAGGGGGNNTPQNITLNLTGTLEVKGDGNTAYLTSADLKNIGLQHLTHLILNETDRYRSHQSGKKLPNEIITPIRST